MSGSSSISGRGKNLPLRWFGVGESLRIGEFLLRDPLLYVLEEGQFNEPSALDFRLQVQPVPEEYRSNPFAAKLPHPSFYPHWHALNHQCRWAYLWWLAGGRSFFPEQSGYAFLYLYGLERRTLQQGEDVAEIWAEVLRLHSLCHNAYSSFRYHAEKLMWFLLARCPESAQLAQVLGLLREMTLHRNYVSEELGVALHWFGTLGLPMPAEAAYHTAAAMQVSDGVVLQRAEPELRQLFYKRYQERYSEGLAIEPMPKRQASIAYYAANALLPTRGFNEKFPNPLGQSKRYEKLSWLLGTCVDDLRKFSTVLGREELGRKSFAAWEALPAEIRPPEHPASEYLQVFLRAFDDAKLPKLLEVKELSAAVGLEMRRDGHPPEAARRLAGAVEASGYLMEPDARLSGKGYSPEEIVLLWDSNQRSDVTEAGQTRYQGAMFLLRTARNLVDKEAGGEAVKPLLEPIFRSYCRDAEEVARLDAAWYLIQQSGYALSNLRVPSGWEAGDRQQAGKLLLEMVTRDGHVRAPQEEVLKAVWKKLGLTAGLLNKELDALSSRGVVFLGKSNSSGLGERLPPPPAHLQGKPEELKLDHTAIASLLEDTKHVQQRLLEAMAGEEEPVTGMIPALENTALPEPQPVAVKSGFDGLAARFMGLLEALLERPEWTETEARDLAKHHNLMLAGAVEAINDWAVDQYGEPLIWHEAEGFTVERGLLE